ncbi:hypothetical protein ABBQ32_003767 [Trebouxia sp. C0010 RCD-2024]
MIFTTLDNFYVSKEALADSPSRKDGISPDVEREQRIYGCEMIQEAGILLRLPQAVMATGQVLLHRFYCKVSLVAHDVKKAAMACVWLATKLEENPRRMRELLAVFYRLDRRRQGKPNLPPLDVYGATFEKWKSDVITLERIMLRSFGFILHVEHPHKFVLNYLVVLEQQDDLESGLLQRAWNLANDSLRSTLCVRFKGEVVACGIIFLAARQLRVPLPENPAWWDVFSVSKQDLLEVACEVLSLYELPKAEYAPISKDAQREQRHLAALKQTAASPISGRPNPGRSPGTASVGAGQQLDLARDTAAAPAGDHGSDGHVNSAEHASSALRQGNGDAKDDHSEHSRSSRDVTDRRGDHKQIRIRSRSRSRSRSAGRSRSRNHSKDRHSRHEEGYREKYRDKSAPKERGSRQDVNSKESRRVVQFDPRSDGRSSRHRHHSRDGRPDRDRIDRRHHRSHSHPSRQSQEADIGHSRNSSDRKRRRDEYDDQSPSEGTPKLSISALSMSVLSFYSRLPTSPL